ncbi:SDR family oxidoreductase [Paenibacillus harenae]|uniref:SDR family oxidoreductase n=1 Tax=Paenibacillus harenae TaxID=306543 RepID=UPI00048BF2A3|nr:SDR family oxidoreductase [Paenibacillus harenae]
MSAFPQTKIGNAYTITNICGHKGGGASEIIQDMIVQMHPMMCMGRPQEIADGIDWLCSDEASFATETLLNMDGGFTAK